MRKTHPFRRPSPIPPAPTPTRVLQVIKWAQVCSSPQMRETDCMACPYRTQHICSDALMADAAAVLMDMTLVVSTRS